MNSLRLVWPFLAVSLMAPVAVLAQKCDPLVAQNPWTDALNTLATSEPKASLSTRSMSMADAAVATAQSRFQHGCECFMAALRARELNKPARAVALLAEAKASLLLSRSQLDQRATVQRSKASYFLGQIAETCERDVRAAAQYYAEADRITPNNEQILTALARVQDAMARRVNFGG